VSRERIDELDRPRWIRPSGPARRGRVVRLGTYPSRAGLLLAPSAGLWLQASAGNRATARLLAPAQTAVQRCGEVPADQCPCHDEPDAGSPQPQVMLQRAPTAEDCTKLIADDDWKVKGTKRPDGYDTSNYYRDVARVIVERAEQRGVDFERALYIVAQAHGEQGPTDPARHRFRILNIQVRDEDRRGAVLASRAGEAPVIWMTPGGRKFTYLSSREFEPACSTVGAPSKPDGSCMLTSPFYVYDNLADSVDHYLDEMTAGKLGAQGAGDILKNRPVDSATPTRGTGLLAFGAALKKAGYATDPRYVAKMCVSYNTVIRDMKTILGNALQTKYACMTEAQIKLKHAWDDLNAAKAELAQANQVGPVKPVVRIVNARMKVARLERDVAERERELTAVEDNIEKLKQRQAALVEIACPTAGTAAAPPAKP
jgi:hypothetical protein